MPLILIVPQAPEVRGEGPEWVPGMDKTSCSIYKHLYNEAYDEYEMSLNGWSYMTKWLVKLVEIPNCNVEE